MRRHWGVICEENDIFEERKPKGRGEEDLGQF
jgi:hypothetical protein